MVSTFSKLIMYWVYMSLQSVKYKVLCESSADFSHAFPFNVNVHATNMNTKYYLALCKILISKEKLTIQFAELKSGDKSNTKATKMEWSII